MIFVPVATEESADFNVVTSLPKVTPAIWPRMTVMRFWVSVPVLSEQI